MSEEIEKIKRSWMNIIEKIMRESDAEKKSKLITALESQMIKKDFNENEIKTFKGALMKADSDDKIGKFLPVLEKSLGNILLRKSEVPQPKGKEERSPKVEAVKQKSQTELSKDDIALYEKIKEAVRVNHVDPILKSFTEADYKEFEKSYETQLKNSSLGKIAEKELVEHEAKKEKISEFIEGEAAVEFVQNKIIELAKYIGSEIDKNATKKSESKPSSVEDDFFSDESKLTTDESKLNFIREQVLPKGAAGKVGYFTVGSDTNIDELVKKSKKLTKVQLESLKSDLGCDGVNKMIASNIDEILPKLVNVDLNKKFKNTYLMICLDDPNGGARPVMAFYVSDAKELSLAQEEFIKLYLS